MGPELMQAMRDQAERFGTRFITDLATKIELAAESGGDPQVWVGDEEHQARTVILAMGAEHKKLGVPGEEELAGRGVSYCATCDAAFFKDKRRPSSSAAATPRWRRRSSWRSSPRRCTIVHRRDEFRASKIMLERARAIENIEFLTPYVVEEFQRPTRRGRARRSRA